METTRDYFLARVDAFLARHPAITQSQLGVEAVGYHQIIGLIRTGSSSTLQTIEKIEAVMAKHDLAAAETAARGGGREVA